MTDAFQFHEQSILYIVLKVNISETQISLKCCMSKEYEKW